MKALCVILIASMFPLWGVTIFSDNMTNFPSGWTLYGTPTNQYWTKTSTRYYSSSYSAKCTPNSTYSNNVIVSMERSINLSGYISATLSFSLWQYTESYYDFIYVDYYSNYTWTTVWSSSGSYQYWRQVSVNIPTNATKIRFRFYSDGSITYEGVYIDDVVLTASGSSGQIVSPNIPTRISDYQLAKYYAPAVYQDIDRNGSYHENGKSDFFGLFNYDYNWNGIDNWDNLPNYSIPGYAYYSVIETETNYFINYYFFHPRDHGEGGPFGCHENDMEGVLIVVQKDPNNVYGKFLCMVTIAHYWYWEYRDIEQFPSSAVTGNQDDIDGDVIYGSRPTIFIEAEGHGITAWDGNSNFPGGDGVIYYPMGTPTQPIPGQGGVQTAYYDIVPLSVLYSKRFNFGQNGNQKTFEDYGRFDGDNGQNDAANAPWRHSADANNYWNYIMGDRKIGTDISSPAGELFMDPDKYVSKAFKNLGNFVVGREHHLYSTVGVCELSPPQSIPGYSPGMNPFSCSPNYPFDSYLNIGSSTGHNHFKVLAPSGATRMRIHFQRIQLEGYGYDMVLVKNQIDTTTNGPYGEWGKNSSVDTSDVWSQWIPGSVAYIDLYIKDSYYNNYFGFLTDRIEYEIPSGGGMASGEISIYELNMQVPNPITPGANILFSVPKQDKVRLVVYNALGQEVKTIMDRIVSQGLHSICWDGKDNNERKLANGVYFLRMETGGFTETRKIVVIN